MPWLRSIWRFLTAPRFNVEISRTYATTVTAGQHTKICTISISHDYDSEIDESQYPRPLFHEGQHERVCITYDNERWDGDRRMVLDLYVRVEKAGYYPITPKFPSDSYVKFTGLRLIEIHVRPSEPVNVVRQKYENLNPVRGATKSATTGYRGDTARIYVEVLDKFKNKYLDEDLEFRLVPSDNHFVKLISTTCDYVREWYVISVRYETIGTTSFELSLPGVLTRSGTLTTRVKIIPAPVSASYSYIIPSDLDEIQKTNHEAGRPIVFKLKLIDIFKAQISYEESKSFLKSLRLVPLRQDGRQVVSSMLRADVKFKGENRGRNREEISFTYAASRDVDSNICELTFTPFLAGKRSFAFETAEGELNNSPIEITVEPGPLAALQIVCQDPPKFTNVFRGDTATIRINAEDEFGNTISESEVNLDLFSENSSVTLESITQWNNLKRGSHVIRVRWNEAGETSFDLIASQAHHQVKKTIAVNVIPPPVSATKSYILQDNLDDVQKRIHMVGKVITLKLSLIDILGNPICFKETKSFLESLRVDCHDDCSSGKLSWADDYFPEESEASKSPSECNTFELRKKEENSFMVCPSDVNSNACELRFTTFKAGKRSFSLQAAEDELNNSPIEITVEPGPLAAFQIVCQDPPKFTNVYRGDTATIWINAEDKFGNRLVKREVHFCLSPQESFVALESITQSNDLKRGSYVIRVRWNEAGETSFDLIASQAHHQVKKTIAVNVIPPPVSATKSYFLQDNLDDVQKRIHMVGKVITLKLSLIDILGNPICLKESKSFLESLRVSCHDDCSSGKLSWAADYFLEESDASKFPSECNKFELRKKEENSFMVCHSDVNSNTCEIKFTPFKAGKRSFFLQAAEDELNNSPIEITVEPGPLAAFQIVCQDPPKFTKVFRGDTATIRINAEDEFENTIGESEVNLDLFSENSSVTLVSFTQSSDSEQGKFVIRVRWNEAGKTSFDLIASQAHHQVKKTIAVNVIPPPVSATKSYILQDNLDDVQKRIHVVGKVITLKLSLIDILGNPICFKESRYFLESLRVNCHDDCSSGKLSWADDYFPEESEASKFPSECNTFELRKKEENSFMVCHSDVNSNACELTFTPFKAGKRVLSLFEVENEVKNCPIRLIVEPGPLAEIHIDKHDPPASNQNVLTAYPKQERLVVVRGKDEFGNEVPMSLSNEWYLETIEEVKQESHFIHDMNALAFYYSFAKPGTYNVGIKTRNSSKELLHFPSFEVEIIKAPLDASKCSCVCAAEKPIFVGETQRSLNIQVTLLDCMGNGYNLTESEFQFLAIKVNEQACAYEFGTERNEMNLTMALDIQEVCSKTVQVMYKEEPIGDALPVKIVGLLPYKTNDFVRLYRGKKIISCKDISRGKLADDANIENINRIIHLKDPNAEELLHRKDIVENTTNEQVQLVNVHLGNFGKQIPSEIIVEIISLFVEGSHHYRHQANEFDREREKWKENSMYAYYANNHEEARACSDIKEKYARLMNQCHTRASDAIFKFYNYGRPQNEIDLHGQLVADSGKLDSYRKQLLRKGDKSAAEVNTIIEREQQERDEAIRKLDERLRTFDHEEAKQIGEDWLEIIDGAGHHSAKRGEQKIRPKVQEYLRKKNLKYVEANEGALLITFSEYTGREPCVADFYCRRCKKTWTSNSSWKGFFQLCFRCDRKKITSECYPFKLRSVQRQRKRRYGAPSKSGVSFTREDHRRLCQKCKWLGKDCMPQY